MHLGSVVNACAAIAVAAVLGACSEPVPGPGPEPELAGNITLRFCEPVPGARTGYTSPPTLYPRPAWLAVKDGDGAWRRIQPSGNAFSFDMTSATGAVSYVVTEQVGNFPPSTVFWRTVYASREELSAFPAECFFSASTATARFDGSLNTQTFVFRHGLTQYVGLGWGSTVATVTLPSLSTTAADVFAGDQVSNRPEYSQIILRRSQSIAPGTTLPTFDFKSAEAFVPASTALNHALMAAPEACPSPVGTVSEIRMEYGFTTPTLFFAMGSVKVQPNTSSTSTEQIPPAKLLDGDLHYATLKSTRQCGEAGTTGTTVTGTHYFRNGSITTAVGPALTAPQRSRPSGRAYSTCRVQFVRQAEYDAGWSLTVTGSTVQKGDPSRVHEVVMTRAYGDATLALEPPDLSAVAGWDNVWGWSSVYTLYGTATATSTPEPWPTYARPRTATNGAVFLSASHTGTC